LSSQETDAYTNRSDLFGSNRWGVRFVVLCSFLCSDLIRFGGLR
jgi:hypothetical protein